MKKYIVSVLIPCLLLQFVGCYSYREITLDELQRYSGENDIRIKTNQDEVIMNRKLTDENLMNWKAGDSSIIIKTTELIRENRDTKLIDKNHEIKYQQIKTIEIEDYDILKTIGLTVGIIGVGLYLISVPILNNMKLFK